MECPAFTWSWWSIALTASLAVIGAWQVTGWLVGLLDRDPPRDGGPFG